MNIRRHLNATSFVLLSALTISCGNKSDKKCMASSEIYPPSMDTVNKKDCNGLKQGMWVSSTIGANKLKDTVYYKNDTLVK